MRGKGEKCEKESLRCRITPAYAGKSCGRCCCVCVTEDHPRLCGEKDSMTDQREQPHRITPAYAGKSFRKTAVRHAIKDHPRLCGEKLLGNKNVRERQGSPPPMRGKVAGIAALIAIFGITPAYAGKSMMPASDVQRSTDHPRLCGEKIVSSVMLYPSIGSPPPMRGKAVLRTTFSHTHRITPAYAGKRPYNRRKTLVRQDHPRLCGEKVRQSRTCGNGQGSPPPMRGKGELQRVAWSTVGITPAYAGKRKHFPTRRCS